MECHLIVLYLIALAALIVALYAANRRHEFGGMTGEDYNGLNRRLTTVELRTLEPLVQKWLYDIDASTQDCRIARLESELYEAPPHRQNLATRLAALESKKSK